MKTLLPILIVLSLMSSCKKENCMYCEMVTRELLTGKIIDNVYPQEACGINLEIILKLDPVYGNGMVTKYECK